jgi:hypothetical protein
MIGITKAGSGQESTQQIIHNSKDYTTIFSVNSISNSNKELLQESLNMMNRFWDHINTLSQNFIDLNIDILEKHKEEEEKAKEEEPESNIPMPKPQLHHLYIYAHNLGKFDGVFLVRSFLQCDGRKKFNVKALKIK